LFISTAGVLGERENISVPLPFADAVKAYDRDGDGKISFDEIPELLT
jgi:Ca2+-binding EF-hand superfamily protein